MKIAGLLASTAVIHTNIPERVRAAEQSYSEGDVKYYYSTCKMCVNFCGIKVKTQNGVLITIWF